MGDAKLLNRPIGRIVMIDSNARSVSLNLENALLIPEFDPEEEGGGKDGREGKEEEVDETLGGALQSFLKEIRMQDIPDVRPVLKRYKKGKEDEGVFDTAEWEKTMKGKGGGGRG